MQLFVWDLLGVAFLVTRRRFVFRCDPPEIRLHFRYAKIIVSLGQALVAFRTPFHLLGCDPPEIRFGM